MKIYLLMNNVFQNLTGSHNSSKGRDPCPSAKPHRILVSIYNNTQQVLCLKSGKKLSDLKKPVENMEQLIIQNCGRIVRKKGKKASCSSAQRIQGRKGRKWLIKIIKALITCWEKLQSVS
ncbi:hypothetical protein FQA47_011864 [Oryzias melastigma]|uniref:Uncharacterized protein n=1 Tax=Oryzias melastigma TaxID=30732 RepID=A0A834CMI7_ORYME|nr:hypothetical protein FQA47_011864 [Oryzias melastigma]